jgi:hypothetical protein
MKYAIIAFSLALMVLLVMEFNSRTEQLNRLTEEKEIISTQKEIRVRTKAALEAQIIFATSEAAVLQWAHEDGHMVREGEVPVVPFPGVKITPTPIILPVESTTETSNLSTWLSLFFNP